MPLIPVALPLWREYERLIEEEAPHTVLYYPISVVAVRMRLQGIEGEYRGNTVQRPSLVDPARQAAAGEAKCDARSGRSSRPGSARYRLGKAQHESASRTLVLLLLGVLAAAWPQLVFVRHAYHIQNVLPQVP